MAEGITVDGRLIKLGAPDQVPVPVLDWNDHGIRFRAGEGYNKRRTQDVDLIVHHWTGGENEPETMTRVLKKRKLGVEFAISRQGVVYQFCDPLVVDTADAGKYNARSCGIEMVNYGFRRKMRLGLIPKRGKDRAVYETVLNGRKRKFASFYPWQLRAAFQLADALSAGMDIPRTTPQPLGGPYECLDGQLDEFTGHIGHFQISKAKADPGPLFMEELAAHFRGEA